MSCVGCDVSPKVSLKGIPYDQMRSLKRLKKVINFFIKSTFRFVIWEQSRIEMPFSTSPREIRKPEEHDLEFKYYKSHSNDPVIKGGCQKKKYSICCRCKECHTAPKCARKAWIKPAHWLIVLGLTWILDQSNSGSIQQTKSIPNMWEYAFRSRRNDNSHLKKVSPSTLRVYTSKVLWRQPKRKSWTLFLHQLW